MNTHSPFNGVNFWCVVFDSIWTETAFSTRGSRLHIDLHTFGLVPFFLVFRFIFPTAKNKKKIIYSLKYIFVNSHLFEQATEQNLLFFLNLALRSIVPHASHFAISPFPFNPLLYEDGEVARFLPKSKKNYYNQEIDIRYKKIMFSRRE